MTNRVVTTLPGGYWADGAHWREAQLREVTGEDQVFLTEECRGLPPAAWVTEALSRCVTRLGPGKPTRQVIRSLSVGDREALLLHLRRLTSGERLECLLSCPSECREKLELELEVADLLIRADGAAQPEHELSFRREDGVEVVVRFRLPTGADQEAVAPLARSDAAAAADVLLRRCVRSVSPEGGAADELPAGLRDRLAARMSELDAQAEIILLVTCAVCGRSFSVIFDAADYLIRELKAETRRLYQEVHSLAYHYHWSAREILRMGLSQRRRFLQLLEDELTRGAS
jgi:hypothetical protein